MHALARRDAPAPAPRPPALRAVEAPRRRPRTAPDAWDIARFAVGLMLGFLLGAVASAPGGGAIVAGQLTLAAIAAVVAVAAALRDRAVRGRRPRL